MTEAEHLMTDRELLDLEKLRAETGDHFVRLEVEIGALGQQVAGLAAAVSAGHDRFRVLEARLNRIEPRLESIDARLADLEEAWRRLNDGCKQMREEDRRRGKQ